MGFDILDGTRCYLKKTGNDSCGFLQEHWIWDDHALNYSLAEKLALQDER